MSEIESTGNQPQGTQTSDSERLSSFLGTGYQHEITSEPEPEPTEAEQTEDAIAQVTEGTDEESQDEQVEAEQPSLPEWLKDFPEDVLAKVQKRYPSMWKRIQDGTASVDDQFFFRDKINGDLEIQRLKAEPTRAEESKVAETVAQPSVPSEQQRAQYSQQLEALVKQVVDPAAVEQFGKDLLAGFGVDIASEEPEVKALVQNAPKVGSTLVKNATDLMASVLPHLITPQVIDNVFPGFSQMYETAMYAQQWDAVRGMTAEDGTPLYGEDMPVYGSKEFGKALREAAQAFPDFEQMVFTDKQGRALPPAQQARQKYQLLAKHMSGHRVAPAEVAKAVETGKRIARSADTKRAAGKALGSGQAKSDSVPRQGDINSDIMSAYNARNGNVWK